MFCKPLQTLKQSDRFRSHATSFSIISFLSSSLKVCIAVSIFSLEQSHLNSGFISSNIVIFSSPVTDLSISSSVKPSLSSVVISSRSYFPSGKCLRWYDVADKIVKYIEQGTFIEEQIHIDEIVEELAEEMIVTAPEPKTLAADEERPYKISLYKNDIELILQSLRAANIPQDDYDRIYEIIGKAEL